MKSLKDFAASLVRKKYIDPGCLETKLARCYGLSDLICMGIGYMVGTGIFVLTGEVVRFEAGSAGILSFLFAGVAATLSALCFSEFAGMVPIAGSAYSYTYIAVGEVWAFIVGWNVVLEYVILSSSAAKSWSATLDSLVNKSISRGIEEKIGDFGGNSLLSPAPDFVALMAVAIVTVFVCVSAKSSSNLNKTMVAFKLTTIAIIVIAGFLNTDTTNWTDPAKGGFAPYGVSGVFTGAATCFFAYVGFDGIAIASEETKNPSRNVPIAILVSMGIVTSLYILTSVVLTLMVPYTEVDPGSPFTVAFASKGMAWALYVVGIGTLFGLTSTILSGLYSLPRLLYAMASDGLIFKSLSIVNSRTQTPLLPIIMIGVICGLLAFFINLNVLVELLSIGTLLSFTFVAGCIIILRYKSHDHHKLIADDNQQDVDKEKLPLTENSDSVQNYSKTEENPTEEPEPHKYRLRSYLDQYNRNVLVYACMGVMIASMFAFLLLLIVGFKYLKAVAWWAIIIALVAVVGAVVPIVMIGALEQNPAVSKSFKVPLVPLLPSLSIFCNMGLMMMLQPLTWLRLAIWLVVGFVIYFGYGYRHSKENEYAPLKGQAAETES